MRYVPRNIGFYRVTRRHFPEEGAENSSINARSSFSGEMCAPRCSVANAVVLPPDTHLVLGDGPICHNIISKTFFYLSVDVLNLMPTTEFSLAEIVSMQIPKGRCNIHFGYKELESGMCLK